MYSLNTKKPPRLAFFFYLLICSKDDVITLHQRCYIDFVVVAGNRTKVDSIKAESQKSGIRRTLTE